MAKMTTNLERVVAVLHDVIENSDCTGIDLFNEGVDVVAVKAIDILTHRKMNLIWIIFKGLKRIHSYKS